MSGKSATITKLLNRYQEGDAHAMDELMPVVYERLRKIARSILHGQGAAKTFVPTALVNQAFVRLMQKDGLAFRDRNHFFSIAARCMRWVLADYARERLAKKRGGDGIRVTLNDVPDGSTDQTIDVIALDAALTKLGATYPDLLQIVELRFLAGLSIEETAEILKCSTMTIVRKWNMAKAWLSRELS